MKRAIQIAFVIVVCVWCARYVRRAWKGQDFGAYHAAARAVLSGDDIYAATDSLHQLPYLYPPTLAVGLTPLAGLSERVGGVIWVLLNLAALAGCLWLLAGLLPLPPDRSRFAVGGLAVLVLLMVVDNDLKNGQANLLVLLGIAAAAVAASRARWFTSGAWLALAACLKATPAIYVLYLAWKGSLRGLAGFGLGVVALVLVFPALVMGPSRAVETNRAWVQLMVSPVAAGHEHAGFDETRGLPYQHGESLRTLTYRLLTHSRITAEPGDKTINVVDLPHGTVEWIYRLLAWAILGATVFAVGRSLPDGDPRRVLMEFGLVAACMVTIAPLSRKAHYVVLLPAVLFVVGEWRRSRSRTLLWLLGAVFVLANAADAVHGTSLKDWLRDTGSIVVAALLLWTALFRHASPAGAKRHSPPDGDLRTWTPG